MRKRPRGRKRLYFEPEDLDSLKRRFPLVASRNLGYSRDTQGGHWPTIWGIALSPRREVRCHVGLLLGPAIETLFAVEVLIENQVMAAFSISPEWSMWAVRAGDCGAFVAMPRPNPAVVVTPGRQEGVLVPTGGVWPEMAGLFDLAREER